MTNPLATDQLVELTRAEFIEFVRQISDDRAPTEEEADRWIAHFDALVFPHPQKNGLIFWPDEGADASPEGIATEVERYHWEHGLPGFKDSPPLGARS